MSYDPNMPKAASIKASESATGFICINILIVKILNTVDKLYKYPNIFVGGNFNIRIRISSKNGN